MNVLPSDPPVRSRRCARCVLPESLPGSHFDAAGQCSWCQRGFPNYHPQGEAPLRHLLETHRRPGAPADCLVGVSGGKDSSYALLMLRRHFGMRVEAFTYTHDGLSDFALWNAKAVCETLGVAHHLVSLPEKAHLRAFIAFFEDWLNTEQALSAAMSCVACKHLHILGTRLAWQRRIPMVVWSSCPLETPPFIPAQREDGADDQDRGIASMAGSFAKAMLRHAGFRRAVLRQPLTCLQGCLAFRPGSGYLQRLYPSVAHLHFFDYWRWNGPDMIRTLRRETPWAIPGSVATDWHSDCVFNVFKEYMFQKMLGVSYTDAFLANQIRFRLLTRDQAMAELQRSKAYFAAELPRAAACLGLERWLPRLDPTCFNLH